VKVLNLIQNKESFTSQIYREDWDGYCRHVQKPEQEYCEKDGLMKIAIEQFIINIWRTVTIKIPTQILMLKMIQTGNDLLIICIH
jgi:hypothetical protein